MYVYFVSYDIMNTIEGQEAERMVLSDTPTVGVDPFNCVCAMCQGPNDSDGLVCTGCEQAHAALMAEGVPA